jgi:hypothetical protein
MEHRCGTRRTIDARVVVDCRPTGLMRGRIKNVSAGGLYVKMRPLRGMTNDQVRLVLVRHDRGVYRLYRLPAVIIRWTRDGAGLMFNELTPNAFYALLSILLAEEQRKTGIRPPPGAGGHKPKPGRSWFNKYDS